ncbi:MAG: hypothetical protein DWQ19_08800 [Crenarchaeota archaeon]|nr:MAG: hypothetical protein DWQ19_08800 [Thermoproteota archaeon]
MKTRFTRDDGGKYLSETQLLRPALFTELRFRGIERVEVEFCGGGDEGGVESIKCFLRGGEVKELSEPCFNTHYNPDGSQEYYWWNKENKEVPFVPTLDDELAYALSAPVYNKYHTFAGEYYVNGKVIFDIEAETIKIEGKESVETWEGFEEEV